MSVLSTEDVARLRRRHLHDQIGAIAPQAIREHQALRDRDGRHRFGRRERAACLRRAARIERESGQR